jgi:transposase
VLEEWKQSGVTIAEFSRRRGLVPERLYLWRKRFTAEASEPARALTFVPATILSTNVEGRAPRSATTPRRSPSSAARSSHQTPHAGLLGRSAVDDEGLF